MAAGHQICQLFIAFFNNFVSYFNIIPPDNTYILLAFRVFLCLYII